MIQKYQEFGEGGILFNDKKSIDILADGACKGVFFQQLDEHRILFGPSDTVLSVLLAGTFPNHAASSVERLQSRSRVHTQMRRAPWSL